MLRQRAAGGKKERFMASPKQPFNVYLEFEQSRWLDSMEGVPSYEPATPAALTGERDLKFPWQKQLHRMFDRAGGLAPGIALAVVLAALAGLLANWFGRTVLGFDKSPISPILVTVILGLILRNTLGLPKAYESGLRFCLKRILRIGVALLGLRLSITAAGSIGLAALPVVIGCIVSALLVVTWLSRWIGLSPRLGSLIAVGTSICGVSAIVATGPAIGADEDEISYSVAVITLFGMVALFTYPFLAYWIFGGDAQLAGYFLGTAIHDTSQVAGAGLMYEMQFDSPEALDVAATTKLVRNVCMGLVIPLMAILHHRKTTVAKASKKMRWLKWSQFVPLFVIGFVVLAAVRSIGDVGETPFGFVSPETWSQLLAYSQQISVFCLTAAMAAVGLGTSFWQLRNLGWKPFGMGFAAAVLVGCVSASLILVKQWLV